jgi:hypothetical protein
MLAHEQGFKTLNLKVADIVLIWSLAKPGHLMRPEGAKFSSL